MKPTTLLIALALTMLFAVPSWAHEFPYTATLAGPPGSQATGIVNLLLDLDLITMDVDASFSGLSGPATGAHVRGVTALPLTGTAGIASTSPTLTGFPVGAAAGTYAQTIDLTEAAGYSAEFITASGGTVSDALNALIFGMADGKMYFEIGTAAHPEGEITGFLTPAPEPASFGMLIGAGIVLACGRPQSAR